MNGNPPTLSARELILALMDSASARTLPVSYFIAAARLLDMDPGSVRVTLARLVRDKALTSVGRGLYQRGNRAGTLHSRVRGWADVELGLKPWQGGWLAVSVAHLGRSDRVRLRGRERAARLFGFAEHSTGLWLRPDNLRASLEDTHAALTDLGLEPDAVLLAVEALAPAGAIDPGRLWSRAELEQRYASNIAQLAASSKALEDMDDNAAARETLLLGRQVTRDILLDPLLPEALVDASLRARMISAMRDYDRLGKRLWRAFYRQHNL